jgi:cell wall assembly regulator SMI1
MDISRILAKWTSDGGRLNPGASPEQLGRLEQAIGVALPRGVRDLYSAANGMVDGTMDPHGVNFWPIEKIVARDCVVESGPTKGIGFADIFIDSWFLLLDVRFSALVVVNESTTKALTPEQFWADYLDRPQSLDL